MPAASTNVFEAERRRLLPLEKTRDEQNPGASALTGATITRR